MIRCSPWPSVRTFPLVLGLALLGACDDSDDQADTSGAGPSSSGAGAEDPTDPGASTQPTTSAGATGGDGGGTSSAEGGGGSCLDDPPRDDTSGDMNPLMNTWGAACQTDDECKEILGDPDAICEDLSVIYTLPGNYCTKPCSLPDTETSVVLDDPTCSPEGGIACIGQKPLFERCAPPCTDDAQCNRHGYICRQMPQIAKADDPTFCLMPDCCLDGCE